MSVVEEIQKSETGEEYVGRSFVALPTSGGSPLSVDFEERDIQQEEVYQKTDTNEDIEFIKVG